MTCRMLFGYPYLYPYLATDEDRAMSYRMMTMVSSFAKDGSLPELVDGKPWPLFSNASNNQFVDHTNAGFMSGGSIPKCPLESIFESLIDSGHAGPANSRPCLDARSRQTGAGDARRIAGAGARSRCQRSCGCPTIGNKIAV
ncbi:hypothetical protein MTO96_008637 [Rhipicephalus appendiculatus]